MPKGGPTQSNMNHHANQQNPNNPAYAAVQNNHANQQNPNNPAYAAVQNNHANQLNPEHSQRPLVRERIYTLLAYAKQWG
jgi:hypothetical protein